MTIWIDADGFPRRQREIAMQAALRCGMSAVAVSDREIPVPDGEGISYAAAEPGEDSSDDCIVNSMEEHDIILTRDVLLMQRCIDQGGICIDDLGNVFTRENIGERLSMRSFMEEYRTVHGAHTGAQKPNSRGVTQFANALDRMLRMLN